MVVVAREIAPGEITEVAEKRVLWLADRPINFERFLEVTHQNHEVELVNGVIVERMSAQLNHERLFAWLFLILGSYVKRRKLGEVLGSRTAVQINEFGGRLPDLLFVRQERAEVLQEKAIYGAPDLIVELISPNDRPSDIIGLETDYRNLGVAEIVFVDRPKRRIRLLRQHDGGYAEQVIESGPFQLESVEGFHLEAEWLFSDPLPDEFAILDNLLLQGENPK
jgi:Uma2 family endonuclease